LEIPTAIESQITVAYSKIDLTMEVKRHLKVKGSLKKEQLCIIRPNMDKALFLIEMI
jgi:hypothetical protein